MVITLIGSFLGIVLTFPVARIVGKMLSNYFPVFNVAEEAIYMDLAASIIIGLIAAIVPTYRSVRIRIADGLRRIG